MSYSQNDEEAVICRLVRGSSRRFLDIGAHDGVTFSNTRRLAENGWGGTLVEPSPAAFGKLQKIYEWREDISLVNVAVVADGPERTLTFYDSAGDMVSTLSEDHRKLWMGQRGHQGVLGQGVPSRVTFAPIQVKAWSVAKLIEEFPGPYELVNLDVEGTNLELFRELALRSLEAEVVCVEYQDKRAEIEFLAKQQGYSVAHATTENLILKAMA